MSEPDILDIETPAPPGQHGDKREGFFRRVSHRTPLRTKLLTAVLALVIMALAAISVTSVVVLRSYLYTQRDSQIGGEFARIVGESPPSNLSLNAVYLTNQYGVIVTWQQPGSQLVAGNTASQGNSVPGNPGAKQSLPKLPAGNWAPTNRPVFVTVPALSGSDAWRVIGESIQLVNLSTQKTENVNLLVAIDLGPVGVEIQRLITVELIVGTAIVVVLAVVGAGVVRTNLRPLNDIELTAGQIAAGHLDHRVPEGDPRTEVGSLGRSLNKMLAQIERAFHAQEASEEAAHESEERMRRFIADASHELRTPLTTIRGFAAHYRQRGGASQLRTGVPVPGSADAAEVSADDAYNNHSSSRTDAGDSWRADYSPTDDGTSRSPAEDGITHYSPAGDGSADGLSPAELDHLMGRVEAEATRMGLLVEDLLTLARLDQQRPLAKAPVDVLTLAVDAVQDARIVSPGRPIDLNVAPGTAFLVDGDEPRLRQVLANLVNNAITHTPAGTPVRVKISRGTLETQRPAGSAGQSDPSASKAPGEQPRTVPAVVLDVEDDGPGMTNDQAQRVFERFYRADAARNRASGGTGLGLAIVAGLVSASGGTVSVRTSPGQGADFQVRLPLSPDALPSEEPDDDLPA